MACPFCRIEVREPKRIIMETDDLSVTPTYGQITEQGGYVLVIPKTHVSCLGALDQKAAERFGETVDRVVQVVQDEYQSPVLTFEHGIVGQTVSHAHLHIVPADVKALDQHIAQAFPETKLVAALSMHHLSTVWGHIQQQPYLYWKTSDAVCGTVCVNPPAPAQYLRILTAKLLQRESYSNWKEIHADPVKKAIDLALIDDTTQRLRARLT